VNNIHPIFIQKKERKKESSCHTEITSKNPRSSYCTSLRFNFYHETRAAASMYASLVFVEFAFTLVKALDGQGRPASCNIASL